MTIIESILAWMHEEDRTIVYMARQCDMDAERLIAIIAGRAMPSDDDRDALAAAMGVEVDALAESENPPLGADAHPLRCYTVREVAGLLGVSEDTVRKELATGALRHIVVGERTWRIPHSALEWRVAM